MLVIVVAIVVAGAVAMRRAGWLEAGDPGDIDRAQAYGRVHDEGIGHLGGGGDS